MYYHLGELNDALVYALGAGELFDIRLGLGVHGGHESEFVGAVICTYYYLSLKVLVGMDD